MSRSRGNTLALTVALSIVIIGIGVFVFFMVRTFGAAREFTNLTDSGALNCSKQLFVTMPANTPSCYT